MLAHRALVLRKRNLFVFCQASTTHVLSTAVPCRRKRPGCLADCSIVNRRSYHSTQRREILPLLGVATVFVIGRYSYKALHRMDAEWEEYQWELQQYEKQLARNNATTNLTKTIAIDLGSVYTKLAVSHPQPEVIVSREGDRAFFNGIIYEDEGSHVVRGRHALERFYYTDESTLACPVTLPWDVLATDDAQHVVHDVLTPALTEVLERLDYKPDVEHPPFRSVATVPSQYLRSDSYRDAFSEIASTFLPEPVAAIWGAQTNSLLPTEDDKIGRTTLVVDVGGQTTQLSLVQKDLVLSSISLPWGGERWIQLVVDLLQKESHIPLQDARSLAALQTQARTAVVELSSKPQVNVHVPYLFPDPGNHHLDTTVSRSVWEQAIQNDIRERLETVLQSDNVLSPHMPTPTDFASLWLSTVTQVLELGQTIPTNVDHVLLVGGACRAPIVSASLTEALYSLMGVDSSNKLVIPESSLLPELTVLGASTMLPNYEYSVEGGLHRLETST